MARPRRTVPLAFLIVCQLIVGLLLVSGVAGAQPTPGPPVQDVEVVNPEERPVPVAPQGDVGVEQRGAWTVSVDGGRQPVILHRQVDPAGPALNLREGNDDFVVPEGKQLVVEYVSMETFSRALRFAVFSNVEVLVNVAASGYLEDAD